MIQKPLFLFFFFLFLFVLFFLVFMFLLAKPNCERSSCTQPEYIFFFAKTDMGTEQREERNRAARSRFRRDPSDSEEEPDDQEADPPYTYYQEEARRLKHDSQNNLLSFTFWRKAGSQKLVAVFILGFVLGFLLRPCFSSAPFLGDCGG